MAYRFLLQVPETMAPEATMAVEGTPDAQVILVRDSHGLGFEDPFVDLTVAAHSLRVIDSLYDWFDGLGASRGDIRLVLHSGERVALEAVDRGAMVATIRRDQPWVERTLPKVGEHAVDVFDSPATMPGQPLGIAIDSAGSNAPDVQISGAEAWALAEAAPEPGRRVHLRGITHIAVMVNDLAKAEAFYERFFDMQPVGRFRVADDGRLVLVEEDYDWTWAIQQGTPADVTFVSNGGVTLALQNAGRGARLERGVVDHISVVVDGRTFDTIKGEALVRPFTVTASSPTAFRFNDPFGLTWEIAVAAPVAELAAR